MIALGTHPELCSNEVSIIVAVPFTLETASMSKRRRERDKPKAAHDAPYHPNKRVLLSYESDEDPASQSHEGAVGTGQPTAIELTTTNYKITEYPEDDGDSDSSHGTALNADESYAEAPAEDESVEDVEDTVAYKKPARSRPADANAATGQKTALGSLSYQWEDGGEECDDYDTTEEEAMAYLRSVR